MLYIHVVVGHSAFCILIFKERIDFHCEKKIHLAGWLADRLAGWLAGWITGWLAGFGMKLYFILIVYIHDSCRRGCF